MKDKNIPVILQETLQNNTLQVRAKVADDLWCFSDHFPQHPIVPGYLQLVWLEELAVKAFQINSTQFSVERVKFHSPLGPGQEFLITARYNPDIQQISFSIESDNRKISSGRLNYTLSNISRTES